VKLQESEQLVDVGGLQTREESQVALPTTLSCSPRGVIIVRGPRAHDSTDGLDLRTRQVW
jgi:hypothetical protein